MLKPITAIAGLSITGLSTLIASTALAIAPGYEQLRTCGNFTATKYGVVPAQVNVGSAKRTLLGYYVDWTVPRYGAKGYCFVTNNNRTTQFVVERGQQPGTIGGGNGGGAAQETILQFETTTYRVTVNRAASGAVFQTIYNKGTGGNVLVSAPAVTYKAANQTEYGSCTTGRNPCNGVEYRAKLEASGRRSLTIRQPGAANGVTEYAQVSPVPIQPR